MSVIVHSSPAGTARSVFHGFSPSYAEERQVDDWLDRVADALDEPAIAPAELGALLKLTRDVAHGVERKFAPVSAFLIGVAVGQRTAEGQARDSAFRDAMGAARALVPEPAPEERES
jgi:hypothetical protein